MKTLLMTVGLPRSGKSTWALNLGYPIVCPDAIRMALYGQAFVKSAESIVWANAKLMVASLFEVGHDTVILDATNTLARYRDEWLDECWQCEYVVFDTSKEECIYRARLGNQEYLVPVIERMNENFEIPKDYLYPSEVPSIPNRILQQLAVNGLLPPGTSHDVWARIIRMAMQ